MIVPVRASQEEPGVLYPARKAQLGQIALEAVAHALDRTHLAESCDNLASRIETFLLLSPGHFC